MRVDRISERKRERESVCNVCSYLCWRCSELSLLLLLLLFWNRARTDEKNIKSYRKSNCRQKQTRRSSICCCFITYFCCYDVTAHALELMPRWLFLMLLLLLALLLHFDFSENAHNKFMWRRLSPGSGTVGSPLAMAVTAAAATVVVVAAVEGVCFLYFICQSRWGLLLMEHERGNMGKVIL